MARRPLFRVFKGKMAFPQKKTGIAARCVAGEEEK